MIHSNLDKGIANRYYFEPLQNIAAQQSFVPSSCEVIVTIRKVSLFIIVIVVLFPLIGFAGYIDGRDDEDSEINSALGIQGWFTQANAKWQISFPYTTTSGTPGKIESRLDFNKIDSPITIITAGSKISDQFSFDVLYGLGSITGGHGTDTDYFLPSSGGRLEFSQSINSLDGDVRMWGINFNYNNKRFGDTKIGFWRMVLGFFHYEDSLTMSNAVQTVPLNFEGLSKPAGPFSGLNSTYDFSWDLLKAGVVRQAELAKGFSYSGMLSVYPYVDYQGEGYWNLRAGTSPSDFRLQSPNFIQKSSKGYGYEASLGLAYELSENMELLAGYRYMYLYAGNGTDTVYFADGYAVQTTLDWVTVTRHGAYAGVVLKF